MPNVDKLFASEERARLVEILSTKPKPFNLQIFANVGHGFAVGPLQTSMVDMQTDRTFQSRARLTDPYEKWAKEQSFKSFVDWIEFWL